jgi:hypothetical protein
MKTILFILFVTNISLFAQGNFTTEWTSPAYYRSYFIQAETNNNTYDIALFQPPYFKVYDGATKNLKYQYSNNDSSYYYSGGFYNSEIRFDVNNDNMCEFILYNYEYSNGNYTFILRVLNGANGSILFQDSGPGTGSPVLIDIDGDNYIELIYSTGENGQYSMKIISTTANAPIGVQNNSNTAQQYKLGQNYPNPFNPTTTIDYTISKTANININIYNEIGQLVKNINEGNKKSGSYKVIVDCNDLASGVYFYELISDGIADAKKMVLIK